MSYCINPHCIEPEDPGNMENRLCRHCGSNLLLFDRYRVINLLSDYSGFARIYEVRDLKKINHKPPDISSSSGRSIILKVLKLELNQNIKALELFKQEAWVLSQFDHISIPKIEPPGYFEYFPKEGSEPLHCFMMEKIEGLTLKEWMNQQGSLLISEQLALNWLEQLTRILAHVHQKNYFHRDIKLQNIMLRPSGELVLIDFGTAREITYNYLAQLGSPGQVTKISSAGYTPPEQQEGRAVPQSDFYALGRTFVYLLTGQLLEDDEVYDGAKNEFKWQQYAADISSEFVALINQLMAYRSIDRPQDTQEILAKIEDLKAGVKSEQRKTSMTRIPGTEIQLSPESPTIPQEFVDGVEEGKKPNLFLSSLVVALLLVGGYGGWQAYHFSGLYLGSLSRLSRLSPCKPDLKSKELNSRNFNARDCKIVLQGHRSFINDIIFTPDSQQLISASADKTIKIWDLQTGEVLKTLTGHTSYINDILVSPDGHFLISASADKTIKIWDLQTGQLEQTLKGHESFVDRLLMPDSGEIIVSVSADKTVRVWDLKTGKALHVLEGHKSGINEILISPDGETLISGSADKTIGVWNIKTGKEKFVLKGHTSFVNALAINPDGQTLATASADKTIRLWDLTTGKEIKVLKGHSSFVNDLIISGDGNLLISASADKTIKIWELSTGLEKMTLEGHKSYVMAIKLSDDGQMLMSSSADQSIKLWNVNTGEEIITLKGDKGAIENFAVSPDGHFIATGSREENITLWRLEV